MYWQQLVADHGINKERKIAKERANHACKKKRRASKRNFLGPEFPGIYLTNREQECVYFLMQGQTLKEIAYHLDLSPRTVEFYLKNVKHKLNCRTKFEIMRALLSTEWYRQIVEMI